MKRKKTAIITNVNPSSTELTNALWDTLKKVQNKKLKPIEANAIARISREMLGVSKLKLEYAKFTGQKAVKDTLMLG